MTVFKVEKNAGLSAAFNFQSCYKKPFLWQWLTNME